MEINNLQNLQSIMKPVNTEGNKISSHEAQTSFKQMLNEAITNVNQKQLDSQKMTEKLVRGEDIDLHDVMITAQKASITLQTTVEVRNKVVEAYQEVMRMQV
ncbi:flagellar hook-basal body complex protein FliE [Evansella tamaricis]|uniref:Flagellar hook-basal body complex protein FliE n=1 Tax=Evansella tamaricis TaxID=2069301 RepID=A0ABS6JLZ5_9BACI|nr:flagellar hook-basal body complex protein FliE [Evansella tamaricis]MBU9714558.1 flagellar hook-basal body complex protein FliE [Evansella tamaricis]